MPALAAILPASGSASRFGRNKLLEPLLGTPVIVRAVTALAAHPSVQQIVVATADVQIIKLLRSLDDSIAHRLTFTPGGATRADSVLAALKQVNEQIEWVAVHDAARPLLSGELITQTFTAACLHGAAVPALPVALTIKQATGPLPAKVIRTVPREELWAMQTPQIARRVDLLNAFANCPIPLSQVTDDVQLIELQRQEVWLVPGEANNLKLTTPLDLLIASAILQQAGER